MARTRLIKPGFFKNEQLGCLPVITRYLFAGMWGQADREGRLQDRPMRLKAEILPYDDCNVDVMLDDLARLIDDDGKPSFIIRYVIDNKRFIQICNFQKHQRPHENEQESTIPAPGESTEKTEQSTTKVVLEHNQGSAEYALDPLTLNLSSTKKVLSDDGKQRKPKRIIVGPLNFETFFSQYPKKSEHENAIKVWKSLAPDDEMVVEIMDGLERYKQSMLWTKDNGQFICNPAKFLRHRKWEDELEVQEHRNPLEGVIMG